MNKTNIEWTDSTWSPLRVRVRQDAAEIARVKGYTSLVPITEKMVGHVGPHCEHVSPGCENCYAETMNHRCLPANGTGLPYDRRSRDLVEPFVDEKILLEPLKAGPVLVLNPDCPNNHIAGAHGVGAADCVCRQRRRRIFVENQSDIFGDWYTDEMLDRIFAVMALCPQHDFQVLTKRPERMLKYLGDQERFGRIMLAAGWIVAEIMAEDSGFDVRSIVAILERINAVARNEYGSVVVEMKNPVWPLPNVWLGISVENQPEADRRIPILFETPAAVRYISGEPLLGSVCLHNRLYKDAAQQICCADCRGVGVPAVPSLDWVIVGGESGRGARRMNIDWARSLVGQCKAAAVPCFVKQLGALPVEPSNTPGFDLRVVKLKDKKGGDWSEWPDDLRVREFPATEARR